MSEVYWECPIGFRWAWSDKDTPPADRMKAQDVLPSLQEQMIQTGEKYTLVVDSEGIAVSTEILTHMSGLLDWATAFKGGPQLQQPALILSTGPLRDDGLIAAAESRFQTNAYHPFATCARGHTGPVPMSRKEAAPAEGEDTSSRRSIDHFCPHEECNGHDPHHFRSNKSAVKDTTFLEEAGIFSYRTIGREERLGYPVATFQEFNLLINRMANRKASGEDKMPADLFKKAPEIFRKRAMAIVKLILTGHYKCKPADLKTRVILICNDASNPELISNYWPIALYNACYQLVNIIITSRLKGLVERYSVLESLQFGFRNSRAVQLVIQKANRLIQEAMKNDSTLIRVDLDFKNAFNSVSYSCLWTILEGFGVPDIWLLKNIYENSSMRVQVGGEGTAAIQLDTGTVQGSVLSPLLFDLFINALLRLLDSTGISHKVGNAPEWNHLAFADDLSLYTENKADADTLLRLVQHFQEWREVACNGSLIRQRGPKRQNNSQC